MLRNGREREAARASEVPEGVDSPAYDPTGNLISEENEVHSTRGVPLESVPYGNPLEIIIPRVAAIMVDTGLNALWPNSSIAYGISLLAHTTANGVILSSLSANGNISSHLSDASQMFSPFYGLAVTYTASHIGKGIAQVLVPGSPLTEALLSSLGEAAGVWLTAKVVHTYASRNIPSSILRGGDVIVAAVGADIGARLANAMITSPFLRSAAPVVAGLVATQGAANICKFEDKKRLPGEIGTAEASASMKLLTAGLGYVLQQAGRSR